jgi:hypothetical protein
MTTILSSSDSAPLNYVVICWNTIVTTLNMSFKDVLPILVLGTLYDIFFRIIPAIAAASIVVGMRFLHPPTCSCTMSVSMLRCPFLGTTCAGDHPHTTIQRGGCLQLTQTWPNFCQLHETSLGLVCLYPGCNVTKACQFEYLQGLTF